MTPYAHRFANERDLAIAIARKASDEKLIDPAGHIAVLSRQLLRECDKRIEAEKRHLEALRWLIAVVIAALFGFALLTVFNTKACGAELLRDGPVQIERPKDGRWTYPATKESPIVRIDETGAVLRRGVPIEQVHREDLIAIIRELMAFELLKSAPPGRR